MTKKQKAELINRIKALELRKYLLQKRLAEERKIMEDIGMEVMLLDWKISGLKLKLPKTRLRDGILLAKDYRLI